MSVADRLRWCVRVPSLDHVTLATLAAHVAHWRTRVSTAYELYVPRERHVGIQIFGELALAELATPRTASRPPLATVLDAVSELLGLLPEASILVMTDRVVFEATPMGFAPRARIPGDGLPLDARPDAWVPVSQLAEPAPLATASPSFVAVPESSRPGGMGARIVGDPVLQLGGASAVILVAALRDRPRSEAQQQLYEQAVYGLGLASAARSAPTLLLALEGGLPDQAASDPRWLATVLDTLSDEARTDLDGPALADNDFALDPARRTILRALEADDVAYARQVIEALRAWVASESDQLEPTPRPPSDEPPGE